MQGDLWEQGRWRASRGERAGASGAPPVQGSQRPYHPQIQQHQQIFFSMQALLCTKTKVECNQINDRVGAGRGGGVLPCTAADQGMLPARVESCREHS